MPYKNEMPLYPFLDPALDPNHPSHKLPEIVEDPYLPLGARQKKRLQQIALERALAEYQPPHVPRSWETDPGRKGQRDKILRLTLSPSLPKQGLYNDLVPRHPQDSSVSKGERRSRRDEIDEEHVDFRRFAEQILHLGYNRFHASYGDPLFPSDEDPSIPEKDICWIMEYTYPECNTIRRQLAHAIGAFPAVADPENLFFDDEIASRYAQRLRARCRRRNTSCIRPSHIEIFTSSGITLP